MRLLVFGKSGQVARELQLLNPQGLFLGRESADFADPSSPVAAVRKERPDLVVNAAAFTGVDAAEANEDLAHVINAESPGALAAICAELSVPFVSISTDYVFDGSGNRPFKPTDTPGPLGAYGRTKLAGEQAIADAGGVYAIIRTSWVFSVHGANFLKTMLRLSNERDQISVVADQIGGPTPASAVADACLAIGTKLLDSPERKGIYHYSSAPDVSWADFARAILSEVGASTDVLDIATDDYPTPAKRPLNSRLDCSDTERVFGIARPDWRTGLREVIATLKDNK